MAENRLFILNESDEAVVEPWAEELFIQIFPPLYTMKGLLNESMWFPGCFSRCLAVDRNEEEIRN